MASKPNPGGNRPNGIGISLYHEYKDVFPEELLGLPPHRDLDLTIEVATWDNANFYCAFSHGTCQIERIKDLVAWTARQRVHLAKHIAMGSISLTHQEKERSSKAMHRLHAAQSSYNQESLPAAKDKRLVWSIERIDMFPKDWPSIQIPPAVN